MSKPTLSTPRRCALVAGALLASSALLLSGCKSAANQSDSGSGQPVRGGTLSIVQSADIAPATFMSQNNPNFAMIRTVFNSLTSYDHKTLRPQPELATSWKVSPDGTSITLDLRQGVKYSTGRAFTAADVIFSIQAMQRTDVSTQLKHVANAITDMKAVDDHTVTLHLAHPVSNLFDMFEMMPIVDKSTFADLLAGKKFIGTGPFEVSSYTPGSGVKLVRNPNYWIKGRPYLDGINISVESQSQSMLSSLKSGQSQLALDMAPLDVASLKGDPGYDVIASDADDSDYYVASNVSIAPLNQPQVRQGIAWAIDRNRILKQALGGIGQTSSLPWSPSSPAYDAQKAATYSQNLGKAKQLIDGAGAKGASVKVAYNAGFATNQSIAEIVQYNLKQAGLKAQLVPLQAPEFFSKLTAGGMPGLFVNVHGFNQLSPATLVKGAFPFNADKNASGFASDQYRTLAGQIWQVPSGQKANFAPLNDFLLHQQFVSDLVVSSHTFTISSKLHGVAYNMYDYLDLDNAYLDK